MTSFGDFPEDEEPTKVQSLQFRAAELVRNWRDLPDPVRREIESITAEHADIERLKRCAQKSSA